MRGVLDSYEQASGHMLNNDKTSVFFSRNTSQESMIHILAIVGVPASQMFDTYLGLPALVGKSRIDEFKILIDRVKRQVLDWKTKGSFKGRDPGYSHLQQ